MILKTFAYHSPSPAGLQRITNLRKAFSDVAQAIAAEAPESRERSLAVTHLETAAMWAVKAVVFNDPESQADVDVAAD